MPPGVRPAGTAPGSAARRQGNSMNFMSIRTIAKKGIGRCLCAEVARRMAGWGVGSFYVEVLEGNPNRFFYEALGARLVARTHHDFAGQRLPSVVYLWTDLKTLVDHRAA